MPKITNDSKVTQGYRVNSKLVWLKAGESHGADATPKTPELKPIEPADRFTDMQDDELSDLIEERDGKRPHHKAGRDTLLVTARKA